MKVTIKPLTLLAATYIAGNLRKADEIELKAAAPGLSPEQFCVSTIFFEGWSYVAYLDDQPVFMFGVTYAPCSPHVASAWGVGTNDTQKVMLTVSKFIVRELIPTAIKSGVRRVEVRVIDTHHTSRAWLSKYLGANFETLLPQMGGNGETFLLLSWTKDRASNVPSKTKNTKSPRSRSAENRRGRSTRGGDLTSAT